VVDHLLHPALAGGQQLGDGAHVLLGSIDAHALDRLAARAVDHSCHHLRLAHRELEPLPAHQLDQDRKRQLTSALNFPHVRPVGLVHA
jgi:hypothetical protein